jgi:AcrR family transcriptional regulator
MSSRSSTPDREATTRSTATAPVRRERRYAGLSDEQRRADRRRRLIEAGWELFGTIGYAATSIERLCAQAGVTARHFYEEFAGREALLVAVYDEIIALALDAIHTALDSAGPGLAARVRAGVEAYVRAMTGDVRRVRIVYLEAVGVSPAMEEHRYSSAHLFTRITEGEAAAAAARGALAPREYGLTAIALAGATNALLLDWARRSPSPPVEPIVDELVRIFVAAMRDS